jgi:hypothetical protein
VLDAAFNRTERFLKFGRDLGVRLSFVVRQFESGALFGRKRAQRATDPVAFDRIRYQQLLVLDGHRGNAFLQTKCASLAPAARDRFIANADDEEASQIAAGCRVRSSRSPKPCDCVRYAILRVVGVTEHVIGG